MRAARRTAPRARPPSGEPKAVPASACRLVHERDAAAADRDEQFLPFELDYREAEARCQHHGFLDLDHARALILREPRLELAPRIEAADQQAANQRQQD